MNYYLAFERVSCNLCNLIRLHSASSDEDTLCIMQVAHMRDMWEKSEWEEDIRGVGHTGGNKSRV